MELIDIRVSDLTDGMITVEFDGEGGEAASVTMAADSNLEREAAILRAKQILVQLTAFGEHEANNPTAKADARGDDTGSAQDIFKTMPLAPLSSREL
ncbi:hypothetical protein GB928_023915 [Shinella curvata]|uniref:Uncharacterized protein n=1 Tax=Shinella curvata TaxID=1817964 RepID=A0ABT8XKL4_9HYPH|nr:hypothetical protein [Shinella curvata]MCJ8056912.1 hypothetical protein [Shinella curvata]MDO6124247.1 hypothetical protein [Shinella curvata]